MIRAKQERAQIYLSKDQFSRALEIFDEMAAYDQVDHEGLRAFGLAGQAVVYFLQEDHEASLQRLADLEKMAGGKLDPRELENKLGLDPRMIVLVRGVIKGMDTELSQAWQAWRDSRFSDDATSPDAG